MLLAAGADPEQHDDDYWTPLCWAANNGGCALLHCVCIDWWGPVCGMRVAASYLFVHRSTQINTLRYLQKTTVIE